MVQHNHKAPVPLLFEEGFQASPTVKTVGFFDLPKELRAPIYTIVLRPECSLGEWPCTKPHKHLNDAFDCTAILRTCSQAYREGVEFLHQVETMLHIDPHNRRQSMFAGPREFGRPGYFFNQEWNYPMLKTVQQKFTELQIVRMRKLAILIDIPGHQRDEFLNRDNAELTFLTHVRSMIQEVAKAIAKSHTLREVRIMLRFSTATPYVVSRKWKPSAHALAVKCILYPLVDAARQGHFVLVLDKYHDDDAKHYDGSDQWTAPDPIIDWLRKKAVEAGVETKDVDTSPVQDETGSDPQATSDDSDDGDDGDDGDGDDGDGDNDKPAPQFPEVLEEDMKKCPEPAIDPYEMVPECRACYETFRDWSGLADHLVKHPQHRRKSQVVVKQRNTLHPKATREPANYKCYTCGLPCKFRAAIDAHLARSGHARLMQIPRYVEDNDREKRVRRRC